MYLLKIKQTNMQTKTTYNVYIYGIATATHSQKTDKQIKPYRSLKEITKQYKKNNRNARIASLLTR